MSAPAPRPWLRHALTGAALAALLAERARARAVYARREATASALVKEQAALHTVAALVARGAAMEELCAAVAEAAAGLLGGEVGIVVRFDARNRATLVGRCVQSIEGYPEPGEELRYTPASAIGTVLATRRTTRVGVGTASPFQGDLGQRVATGIELGGRLWGAVAVGGASGAPLPADAEARIERFAELMALAIANSDARAQLLKQATTDPLTGVANRGAFSERLADEVKRARRYGRPLALIVFDVDRFKSINDSGGHLAGDEVLVEVARRIAGQVRGEGLVGRLGGDEFAAVVPESDARGGQRIAERARQAVSGEPIGALARVTLSAGVSDLSAAESAEELLGRADDALYAVKGRGRDGSLTYHPPLSAA